MAQSKITHYNLINATLVRESDKAILIKCEVFIINKDVPQEVWFPKSNCKLVDGMWQVSAKFMRVKALELGYSIHSQEVWG